MFVNSDDSEGVTGLDYTNIDLLTHSTATSAPPPTLVIATPSLVCLRTLLRT